MTGEVLRLLRIFNNIKASDLANQLGISKSYLSEIEHDKKKPSIDIIEKYAELMNVKPSTVLLFSEALDEDSDCNKNASQTVAKAAVKWLRILEKAGRLDEDYENVSGESKPIVQTEK